MDDMEDMDGMVFGGEEGDDHADGHIADISPMEDAHINAANGYKYLDKICDSIQGEVFKAELVKSSPNAPIGSHVAIKRTHKTLFEEKMVFEDEDGMNEFVEEDVVKEAMILNHLTINNQAAAINIVKYIDFFESEVCSV